MIYNMTFWEITKAQKKKLDYYDNILPKITKIEEDKHKAKIEWWYENRRRLKNIKPHYPVKIFINHLNKNIDKCDVTEEMLEKEVQLWFDNYK